MADAPTTPAAPTAPVPAPTPAPRGGDAIRDAAAQRRAAAPTQPAAPTPVRPPAPGRPAPKGEPKPIPTTAAGAADDPGPGPDLYGDRGQGGDPGQELDPGQEPVPGEELEEGQEPVPGDDPDAGADGDGDGAGDEGEWETVALPGRRPGDPDLELDLPTDNPEVIERVRQLVNGYERKAESHARLQEAYQALDQVEEWQSQLHVDPMSTIETHLNPEQQAHLALRLLAGDELFQRLGPTLEAMLTDPNARQVVRSELEADRYRLKEEAQQQVAQRRAATRNARDITRAIEALCPTSMPAAQRQIWKQDAIAHLSQYVTSHNLNILHPLDIPVVLAARLRASGIDPQQAATHLLHTFTGRGPASPARQQRPTVPAKPAGERLPKAAQQRRAARAAAPSGSGAPTASQPSRPPAGMNIKEATNWVRGQRGLPAKD